MKRILKSIQYSRISTGLFAGAYILSLVLQFLMTSANTHSIGFEEIGESIRGPL